MNKGLRCAAIMAFFMLALVGPALAQEEAPKYEVFGGFSALVLDEDEEGLDGSLKGWDASIAFNLNQFLAIKADVGGVYGEIDGYDDSSVKRHNFLGGVQITRRFDKFNVFGEVLAGYARIGNKLAEYSYDDNAFAMAFGGGFDWKFSQKIGWRVVKIDYMPMHWSESFKDDIRFSTGILIPLGK